jgi:nitroreductase
MDTFEAIRTLRSVREFDERAVPDEIIKRILEAGRLSGSSKNTQPWQFILIKNRDTLNALADSGNYAKHLRGANFAIAVATETTKRAEYDTGRCTQNMMLAAWNDGVGSCIASMHREQDAKRVLGIPDDYTLQLVLSFGYPALSANPLNRPPRKGGRQPLNRMLHNEHW